MNNLGAFTFAPVCCPKCGHGLLTNGNDYFGGSSHSCNNCGFRFQYIEERVLRAIAQDIDYYEKLKERKQL